MNKIIQIRDGGVIREVKDMNLAIELLVTDKCTKVSWTHKKGRFIYCGSMEHGSIGLLRQ